MWRLYSNSRQSVRPFIRLSVRPFSFVYPSIWNRIRATHHWNSGHLSLLALYSLSLLRVVGCCSLVVIVDWISRFEYKFFSTITVYRRCDQNEISIVHENFSHFSFPFFPLMLHYDTIRSLLRNLYFQRNFFERVEIRPLVKLRYNFSIRGNSYYRILSNKSRERDLSCKMYVMRLREQGIFGKKRNVGIVHENQNLNSFHDPYGSIYNL